MTSLDADTWRSERRKTRDLVRDLVRARDYGAAERCLSDLLLSVDCRRFDSVLCEDFTNPAERFAGLMDAEIEKARDAVEAVAVSLDLERDLGNDGNWVCAAYGFPETAYAFSGKSLAELNALADENPWQGMMEWFGGGFERLTGFDDYQAACRNHSREKTPDSALVHDLAELLVGVKYHRYLERAVALSRAAPIWLLAQDHDCYWIPRGVFRTGTG